MKAITKFRKVLGEYKDGKLHHGTTGKVVKDKDMALAIAFSEAQKINPRFGKKSKYANGGELRSKYKADDYYSIGQDVEFMFDTKSDAESMAKDFNTSVIEENDLFFVSLPKHNLDVYMKGGEIKSSIQKEVEKFKGKIDENQIIFGKLKKEINKNGGRIHEDVFKKIAKDSNPSRIRPFWAYGLKFEKCLFSPHYKCVSL